jgi:peptidoglycan/xylan/chitin deacetylase (PgdA/CDA1 family)
MPYKLYLVSIILIFIIAGCAAASASPHPKAGFEAEYESWVHNADMHMQKGQYANALLCYFKAKRLKPGGQIESLINKAKESLNTPSAAVAELSPIPVCDERIVAPQRNSNRDKNKKSVKRVQFFRKNYGFLIFPKETMNLREGEFFDYNAEDAASQAVAEVSKSKDKPADKSGGKDNSAVIGYEDDSSDEDGPAKEPAEIKEYFVNIDPDDEDGVFNAQTVLRRGIKHGKMIALTFDDGPHPTHTPKILKILKANDVKATFFMLGSRINEYGKIAASVHAAGHDIGNHSYSHPFFSKTKHEKIDKEISRTDELIKKITKFKEVKFLRPPYGSLPKYVIKKAENEGFYVVMWSIDSKDYQGHSVDYMLDKILKRIKSGDVMLFHDIHPNTVKLMAEMIPILKKAGFKFVSLNEIYDLNYTPKKQDIKMPAEKTQEVTLISSAAAGAKIVAVLQSGALNDSVKKNGAANEAGLKSSEVKIGGGSKDNKIVTKSKSKSKIKINEEKISSRDFKFRGN